jgi:hypothetical protein
VNWKQQHYRPTQPEHDQRLILRLRHLADVVNVKLARADRLARDGKTKNIEKEDTHDKTKPPLSQ